MKRKSPPTQSEDNPELPLESASEEVTAAADAESAPQAFESVKATAMEAVEVVSEAAEEVMETVQKTQTALLPAVGEYVGKAVYGTFYYASYGAVFGALYVARMLPMDNLVGRAIKEGASAAREAAESRAEAAVDESTVTDEPATLNA